MNLDIQTLTTPAGINVWYVQDKKLPVVIIRANFLTGSNSDIASAPGRTSLLASMLDEGAGPLSSSEFQDQLRQSFARLSFSASRDAFSVSLRTLTENQDKALELMRLAINEPRFDDEPLDRVRNQTLSVIREEATDPNDIANKALFSSLFGSHPYGQPTIGTTDSVANTSALDLRLQKNLVLTRDRLMVSVVGDIDPNTLAELLDKTFKDLPASSELPPISQVEWADIPQIQVVDFPNPQSVLLCAMPSLPRQDPLFIPMFVLTTILGEGGFTSRLVQTIREERGLAYSVGSTMSSGQYGDSLIFFAQTNNDRIRETVQIMREQISILAKDGVTDDELQRTKDYLTGSFALRYDSNGKIASQLAGLQVTNRGIDYVRNRNDYVRNVTQTDLKRVAELWLDVNKLKCVIVGSPTGLDDAPRISVPTP